jgi:glycosyltransferase involved in cell wall biosynthesis
MPKLSIITVNYNNLEGLKKTVESVLAQTFVDFEYVLIDGGSDDGSKLFIEANANHFSYWVSERDGGVYEAMNKGIQKATGEYFLFLNSGDYLSNNDALSKVFSIHSSKDIIYCNLYWEEDGKKRLQPYPDVLTFEHFIHKELPHQASFIKKEIFSVVGYYDTQYKIIADWKFFILAILKFNCTYQHIEVPVSVCDRNGMSCDPSNSEIIVQGRNEIIKENFSVFLNDYNNLINARSQLIDSKNQILRLQKNLGYRVHNRIKRLLNSNGN